MPNTAIPRNELVDPTGITFWPLPLGRDGERTPMQWTRAKNAGFTSDDASPWLRLGDLENGATLEDQKNDERSLWNWYRSYNTGAAFSLLSDAGGWQQVFFSVLAMVVSVALGIALKRLPRADWRQAAPYALIIGGALGNAADRIARGHVVDFIQWHWKDYYWPSFNLGDVAIVVGVVGLVLSEGVSARRQRSPGARRAGR